MPSILLQSKPDAKIGILYQNDDYGKDCLKGFKDGLAEKASTMIVAEVSYEATDATIDSQIVSLQASPTDFYPIEQTQLIRFDGKTWVGFGELMSRLSNPAL